jgi:hypothetical protein
MLQRVNPHDAQKSKSLESSSSNPKAASLFFSIVPFPLFFQLWPVPSPVLAEIPETWLGEDERIGFVEGDKKKTPVG